MQKDDAQQQRASSSERKGGDRSASVVDASLKFDPAWLQDPKELSNRQIAACLYWFKLNRDLIPGSERKRAAQFRWASDQALSTVLQCRVIAPMATASRTSSSVAPLSLAKAVCP